MSVRFDAYANAFRSRVPLASEKIVALGHLPAAASAELHMLNTRYRITGLAP